MASAEPCEAERHYSHPKTQRTGFSRLALTKQALTRQGASGLCSNYFESRQSV
ncbi:hypothetical protein [Acinetobacter baumannii]|uniref:hypothetical protein n=1 Tax=Acinetobacter baumannii TaxID=470 RepID=UPI0023418354|nr:hypothetical protein [Acinetobacter baumannii]MDC4061702.1 hypothetical protein [Acinetobacter baumannii]